MSVKCFMVPEFKDLWHPPPEYGNNVGAMTPAYNHPPTNRAPHLWVMTPAGLWCADCPATDAAHGYWGRTGTPPNITTTPSININNGVWHGYLTNGELIG